MTVDDGNGNTTTCNVTLTGDDATDPVAVCKDITVQLDASGNALITATEVDGGSSDNCGIATMSLDIDAFTCADLGGNIVTLTVMDINGNSSTCQATVTVEDPIDPAISCPGDTVVTPLPGNCTMLVTNIGPVLTNDNCSTDPVTFRLEGATSGTGMLDVSGTDFNKGVTTVWYRISDQSGNADSCSFDVVVLAELIPPDSIFSDSDSICPGDGSIVLSFTGGTLGAGVVARWYSDTTNAIILGTGNNLNLTAPITTTEYFVRFEGNCDSTGFVGTSVYVGTLVVEPGSANIDRDTICSGDGNITLAYTGGNPGNGMAVWYSDSVFAVSVGTGNDLTIPAPDTSTTYYVRFESYCDTTPAVSVGLTTLATPEPAFTELSEHACINGPLYLYVASGQVGSSYIWNIENGTIVENYNDSVWVDWGAQLQTGRLEFIETTLENCSSAPVEVSVAIDGLVLELGEDIDICQGESETIISQGDFVTYLWHDGSTGVEYFTNQEGWISLEVTDSLGCIVKDSLYVSVHETPSIYLGPDTTICWNDGLILDAGSGWEIYLWSTGEISQQITVYREGDQEIWVEVQDAFGCTGSDTMFIEECDLEHLIELPTGFTPNDDGVNDVWNIYALRDFEHAIVEVFDQWGTLIWRSEPGYSQPWDGNNMRGAPVPVDSYHFVIHYNDGSDERLVGYVTVIK